MLPGTKRRPIRLPKEALDMPLGGMGAVREVGGVGTVGEVGGVGGLGKRHGLGINYKLSFINRPAAVGYHRRF